MANDEPRSFKNLESWKQRDKEKNLNHGNVESTVTEYSPKNHLPESKSNLFPEKNNYFDIDLSPDFIKDVDSNSRAIAMNNKSLEQKIKAELAGVNIFKKGSHILRTVTSRRYREQTADDLINNQLKVSANFRDSIKAVYLSLSNELNKNIENVDNLERDYFKKVDERESVKKTIQKTQKDYLILKEALEKGAFDKKEKLKVGKTNAHRAYRKAISKLDELNSGIVSNIEERGLNYNSEVIFERYEGAFKKIYEIAESEIRKIDRLKGLYINAMRGGKIINNLERSFEDVFSSLRIMDNVLLKGINSIMESSSDRGRIRELKDEKTRNSRRLLETIKNSYLPDAERLNSIVEGYIRGEK